MMEQLYIALLSLVVLLGCSVVQTTNSTQNQACRNVVYNVEKLKQDISKQSSDPLLVHLVSVVTKQAVDINEMKNKLQKHTTDINKIKNKHFDEIRKLEKKHAEAMSLIEEKYVNGNLIAFHVALTHHHSSKTKIEFDRVLSNYGNGWSNITHTFTVPVKGLYYMSLTIMDVGSSEAYSFLMRGSEALQLAHTSRGATSGMSTTSTVLTLDAGEHIYAKHQGGTIFGSENLYTHLVGFLIQHIK